MRDEKEESEVVVAAGRNRGVGKRELWFLFIQTRS